MIGSRNCYPFTPNKQKTISKRPIKMEDWIRETSGYDASKRLTVGQVFTENEQILGKETFHENKGPKNESEACPGWEIYI